MPQSRPGSRSQRRSWRRKLAFALIATLGFFLLLESGLALVGLEPVTATHDPFAGFSQIPLLEPVEGEHGEPLLTTARHKLVWFNAQTFPKAKPPGTRRVVCVGGSTTYGRPYWDATSYSGWLRELLPAADGSCDWEVINAGGVSYASYRVAAVMDELARYEPDLFIVYSAHNEFLERRTYEGLFEQSPIRLHVTSALSRTRTWALVERVVQRQRPVAPADASGLPPEEVDEILNHTVGPSDYHRDAEWRQDVLRHYELNLRRMVRIARRVGAQIVFVTPASNEKDCSPFKSEPIAALSNPQARQFQSRLERAQRLLDAQQPDDALILLKQAQAIDAGHAMLDYQIGKTLLALDRKEEARQAFGRALEQDVCPLRALPGMTEAIRRVARRERAAVVDFDRLLKDRCAEEYGHRCLGAEYFLDHVHPTIDVHRKLACWIIETLQREGIARGGPLSPAAVATAERQIKSRIDRTAHGVALRNLAKVLHWAGKFDEAAPRAADALALIEDDLESQFLLAECLRQMGRDDDALTQFERLFAIEPNYDRGYIPFGKLLSDRGHLTAAKMYLSMGVVMQPDRDDALLALGRVHLRLGEIELAEQSLREAARLNPKQPSTYLVLARMQVELGKPLDAVPLYEQALRLNADDADVHNELGEVLLRLGRTEAAAAHFLAALSVEPDHEDADFNLDTVRQAQ